MPPEKQKKRMHEYYIKNREKIKNRSTIWNELNLEKRRTYCKKHRLQNRCKIVMRKRTLNKKYIDDMSDQYIRYLLARGTEISANITLEMIECKRLQISIMRNVNE